MRRTAGVGELMRLALERGAVHHRELASSRHEVDVERPHRVGSAPAVFSTCTELTTPFWFVWDVSGYYRALGLTYYFRVEFLNKRLLREAYFAVDGQSSEYLTYVMSQLLDREVRAQYDARPPGSVFWDKYVAEEVNRQFKARMAMKLMDTEGDEERALAEAREEGWASDVPIDEQVEAMVDGLSRNCDDQPAQQDETPPPPFPWGHYLWRSQGVEPDQLAEWQRLVILAAAERGIRAMIAVGACGRTPHRTVVAKVGSIVVAFLNDEHEPSPDAAGLAVDAIAHALAD